MTNGASLAVDRLEVGYGDFVALSGIDLEAAPGTIVALLGPNGAGKSSLARAVSGLIPVQGGSIRLDGVDITRWPAHRVRRAGLAYVPEGRGIFPGLSVIDNLKMAVRQAGGRAERRDALDRATTLFPILADRRQQRAGSLSGGEQQMLGLARALAVKPRLVIVDEMSLGLAPIVVERVFESMRAIRDEGITVLLIEQFVNRALELADHCVILTRGTIGWQGAAADAGTEIVGRYLGEGTGTEPRVGSM
jgi:branched-chain amino acid transport system ATP-binding protein